MSGIEDWLPNPQCAKEEAKSMPQGVGRISEAHLQNEVVRLTAGVAHWKDRAVRAEAVVAQRDASVFTATGRRPKRGVQFGGLTE